MRPVTSLIPAGLSLPAGLRLGHPLASLHIVRHSPRTLREGAMAALLDHHSQANLARWWLSPKH